MNGRFDYTQYPNSRQSILTIQKYLRQLSYFDRKIPCVPIDGIYGSETRRSVAAFQSAYGLPVTGIVDYNTWNRLRDEYIVSVTMQSLQTNPNLFPYPYGDINIMPGDNTFLTAAIHHMLDEISLTCPGTEISEQTKKDGVFNQETQNAVKNFQHQHKLDETGTVDIITWNKLAGDYNSGRHRGE